jgi:thymidylate synthase
MKYTHKDGTPYLKEEFLQKLKTDKEFNDEFGNKGIDQIQNLINELKTNPDSRRLMVNAWNVGELDQMVLPPCHYGFQVYTRELSLEERLQVWNIKFGFANEEQKNQFDPNVHLDTHGVPTRAISLMWNQRSVDTFLGLPFNIASYGLLLMMIADEVNMVPDELIGNLGDTHLYLNHIEQAKEQIGRELSLEERKQIFEEKGYVCDVWPFNGDWSGEYDGFGIPKRTREPYPLPTVHVRDGIYCSSTNDVILENYQSHPTIKAPLSN